MIDLNVTLLVQWGIYVALMIFLHFYLFKPVLRVIDARKAKVEGTFAGAEDLKAKALSSQNEYQGKLDIAKERLFAKTAAIREASAKEAKELMEKARDEALGQVESTKERVRQDTEIVRKELVANVDSLARGIAGKILERQI